MVPNVAWTDYEQPQDIPVDRILNVLHWPKKIDAKILYVGFTCNILFSSTVKVERMRTGKNRDGCSLLALAARSGSKDVVLEVKGILVTEEVKIFNLP